MPRALYGAADYVKNISFDMDTGEILTPQKMLELDVDKIKANETLDGYYVLHTSKYKEINDRFIEIYKGLRRIEESFRITKSDLEACPV